MVSLFSTINVKTFFEKGPFWALESQNFEKIYQINIKIQAILDQVVQELLCVFFFRSLMSSFYNYYGLFSAVGNVGA